MSKPSKILVFFVVATLAACSRPAKPQPYYIDRLQLSDATLQGNAFLAMKLEDLQRETYEALERTRRFVPLAATTQPRPKDLRAMRCRVEVAFTREALDEETGDSKAEVGVVMELRRVGEVDRFQATGLSRGSFPPGDPVARVRAFRAALAGALDEVSRSNLLHLDALEKPDAALIADLGATDPRVRDYAIQVLGERRSAAAVPGLVARLGDDRDLALKAVGALGAIGDPSAVPALIEMGQTRDPQFLVALTDVVARLGGKDAEAFLFTLESGHSEEEVRRAAQEALVRLRAGDASVSEPPRSP